MTEKLTFEKLKQLANDTDLDLSAMQLTTIPWRELAKLTRVTHIDLSNNQIAEIPPEFCSKLKQLKHLDLSRNKLGFLPDNFGELSNLQHLDLHQNSLEELPLSFSKLIKLKWLNMKDNQLDDSLISAAGRFENYGFAAQRVLEFAKSQEALHKKILQDQKKTLEKTEAAKKAVQEDPEKAAKKKKKKAKKSDQKEMKSESEEEHSKDEMSKPSKNQSKQSAKPSKKATKTQTSSPFSQIFRLTLWIILLSVIITALFGFVLYDNCTVPAHRWIPKSNDFCIDASRSWSRRQISPTLQDNSKKVLISMYGALSNRFANYAHEVSKSGIWATLADLMSTLQTKLFGLLLLMQRMSVQLKDATLTMLTDDTKKALLGYLNYLWECVALSLKIAYAIANDLFWTSAEYVTEWFFWSKEFASVAFENPSKAWVRIKTFWNLA